MELRVLLVTIFVVFSLPKAISSTLTDSYFGCYRNFDSRSSMSPSLVSQSMTIELCISTCRRINSTFAGLKGGDQCFCGEDFKDLVPENNCTDECSGSDSQFCGGTNTTAVYSACSIGYHGTECNRVCHCDLEAPCSLRTGSCPTGCERSWLGRSCETANASPSKSQWYIGCFADEFRIRAMGKENPGGTTKNQGNPTNACLNICAGLNNTYIGTQYFWDCNCAESYSMYGPSKGCTYPCRGNNSQICGGWYANSVYSVCPAGTFSKNCLSRCYCLDDARCVYSNGTCPAGCKPGWSGDSCSTRNCSEANGSCSGPNEFCETIDLKYATKTRCGCNTGYTRDAPWRNCEDINECLDIESVCGKNAYNCTNTDGGFLCFRCPDGLILHNGSCIEQMFIACKGCDQDYITIIGVSLGIVVVLVIITVVVIILCHRNRSTRPAERPSSEWSRVNDYEEVTFHKEDRANENLYANECPYVNVETVASRIQVSDIINVVRHFNEAPEDLEKEFNSVPESSGASCNVGKGKELKKKNRFKNILPYDHNRVILSNIDNQDHSDYINASYITLGGKTSDRIIASQAPTPESLDDFWRMIFEKRVTVIVMMTNLHENGKKKCEKYWPDVGNKQSFGAVTVNTLSERKWQNFEQRSLLVERSKSSESQTETLEIKQWQYTSWPDHGVPKNSRSFLTFRRKVRESMSPDSLTVIHCSAGAGRTGSFIAIDYLIEEGKTGFVDVLSCLTNLRQQRTQMIQTLEQYKFVYIALMEAFSTGDTVLRRDDYEEQLSKLRIKNPMTGKSRLSLQFEMLNRLKPDSRRCSEDFKEIVLPSTRPDVHYIVKAISPSETSDDLWKLCDFYRSHLFIFINESHDVAPFIPTQDKSVAMSNFDLILSSTTEEGCVTVCQTALLQPTDSIYANQADSSEAHKVTLLNIHVKSSPKRDFPDYESLFASYALTRNFSQEPIGPILIMSQGNARLSGFFVAAFNAFDMMIEENQVDVYQIVCDMQMSNFHLFSSLSAYEELHDFIKQYIIQEHQGVYQEI